MTTKETLTPEMGAPSVTASSEIRPEPPLTKPVRRPRTRQAPINSSSEVVASPSAAAFGSSSIPSESSSEGHLPNEASGARPRRRKKPSIEVVSSTLALGSAEPALEPPLKVFTSGNADQGSEADWASGVEDTTDDDEPQMENRAPRPEPVDVGEVFSQVLSGEFDVGSPELPPLPAKRVLLPDPDAPKLQKVLAQAGVGSRRDMEQMIADGQVTVNGHSAHVGQRISFGDQIKIDGKPIRFSIVAPPPRILAYHKPAGEVVTHDDPQHRPTVFRRLPRLAKGKWQSVGRLDRNTERLRVFTNSGALANQLRHPRFGVEREDAVRVRGTLE
ncbi:MAG: pseudouridine synthase, partial [Burkholderiales bacterium]